MLARFVRPLLVLAALALAPAAAPAVAVPPGLPAGYQFSSILDATPASMFRDSYSNQVMSIGTALNANGNLFGFWLTHEGMFRTYSLQFASNPLMTVRDTPNFVGLSGSDITCVWIFCSIEYPFGIRLDTSVSPPRGVTAFVNTPAGTAAIPKSLPFSLFPGNFVDENRKGIVATTQVAGSTRFGVLINGSVQVVLDDVPWLVAIDDLAEPLVLAYDGDDGDCVVFGTGCVPDPATCDFTEGDQHSGLGVGHEEHGEGYGYGHDKCGEKSASGVPKHPSSSPGNGALLVRLLADASTLRYRFPVQATDGAATYALAHVFPLALSDSRAVLRGDVVVGNATYEKRLLSCVFNPAALDPGGDGTVDCTGGLTIVGGLAGSVRVGTVLGFTLNNNGVLAGNLGYNAAGIGAPFVLDVAAATPVAQQLVNLASGADNWELNALTDLNPSNKLIGYGYRNCAALPEAFFLNASTTAPAGGALTFQRGAFEFPASLVSGNTLPVAPTISGGSGSYEFRVSVKTPADADWTLFSDWAASGGTYDPGSYLGDVCFRIEARDTASPAAVRSEVVRYRVVSATVAPAPPDEGAGDSTNIGVTADNTSVFGTLLGATGLFPLLLLAGLALRRRA